MTFNNCQVRFIDGAGAQPTNDDSRSDSIFLRGALPKVPGYGGLELYFIALSQLGFI